MSSLEALALGVAAVAFAVAAMIGRRRHGASGTWAWSWAALIGGGALFDAGGAATLTAACLLASLFPALQLAGAYEHASRAFPTWALAAGALVGLLRVGLVGAGFAPVSHLVVLPLELAALAGAFALVLPIARSGRLPGDWLVVAGFFLIGVAESVDAVSDFRGSGPVSWPLWLAIGIPVGSSQILSSLHRMQRQLAESLDAREAAVSALEESTRRFRAIAESSFDLIAEADAEGRILWASPGFATVLGYETDELIGRRPLEFVHADDRKVVRAATADFARTGAMAHPPLRFPHRDGSWRWIEGTARRYEAEDGSTRIVVVNRDVSRPMELAAALKKSEERFRALAERSLDLIAELDSQGRFLYVSPNVERVLGYKPETFVGRTLAEIAIDLDSSRKDELQESVHALRARGPLGRLSQVRAGDGSLRWIETDANPFDVEGDFRLIAVTRDVTARVELTERLRHAERLEGLGVMAGGIAHDFNNLLVSILGNVSLARKRLGPDDPAQPLLADAEAVSEEAAQLTQRLLAYAGRAPLHRESLDLSRVTRGLRDLVRTTVPDHVRLRTELAPEPLPVEGDVTQVRQLVLNLVKNAVEAIGERSGEIVIRTRTAELSPEDLSRFPLGSEGVAPGSYAALGVSDDGCGLDDGTRARIFDPFFSTKQPGRGLGLASLWGIVRAHGGAVRVQSEAGRGSTFEVFFPRAAEAPEVAEARPTAAREWRGTGTVLVVDDEPGVRNLARRVLEEHGFFVLLASDGRQGVERFRRHEGEIVLVLLDLTMPGMRGDEALREIRRIRSDARVLLSSGYSEGDLEAGIFRADPGVFLKKPYRPDDLVEKVREAIDGR